MEVELCNAKEKCRKLKIDNGLLKQKQEELTKELLEVIEHNKRLSTNKNSTMLNIEEVIKLEKDIKHLTEENKLFKLNKEHKVKDVRKEGNTITIMDISTTNEKLLKSLIEENKQLKEKCEESKNGGDSKVLEEENKQLKKQNGEINNELTKYKDKVSHLTEEILGLTSKLCEMGK
jgi:hypothetical protein